MTKSTVRVGFGQLALDLDEGLPMTGFAARTDLSIGHLDPPLAVCALAIEDEVLLTVDAIGVDQRLGEEIAQAAGLAKLPLLTATHTHGGPGIMPGKLGGGYSAKARAEFIRCGAQAIHAALGNRRECCAEWLKPRFCELAHDRRKQQIAQNAMLRAIRFIDENGGYGYLISYPCHPTVIGPANLMLTPDYPGYLRRQLWDNDHSLSIFLTGCAGNINAGHAVSKSYSLTTSDSRSPDAAKRFGTRLANELSAGEWLPVDLSQGVCVKRASVMLNYENLDELTPAELAAQWSSQIPDADPGTAELLRSWVSWAQSPTADHSGTMDLPVALLKMGEIRLALLPGEPFLAAEEQVSSRIDAEKVLVVGYFGNTPGYLPGSSEYANGGYEVIDAHRYYGMPAPFAAGSLERLTEAVVKLEC